MAARICPLCMRKVSGAKVVAYSNDLECPGCRARLEISPGSRSIATWVGLAAGALVWRLTARGDGMLGWVLPVVCAFLAFSVVSPLVLMLIADLRVKKEEPPAAVSRSGAPEAPVHTPSHH